ncbi:MAG: carboxypeptidase-like regulatory domain-containing protein [Bryobacteraceae bacterium]
MLAHLLLVAFFFQPNPTYVISGTVVNRIDGKPLEGVRVSLGAATSETLTTGRDGKFRFEGLKQGKYGLRAERNGFGRQSYRQRSLYANLSTGIVTGEHETTENLVFGLIPESVISGTITDGRGNPVPGLRVLAYPISGVGENRRAVATFRAGISDDRGEYRIPGLPAGSYALVYAGWTTEALPDSTTPSAYPTTYFPGAASASDAGLLRVESGKETRADAIVRPVAAGRVTVKIDAPNPPQRSTVRITTQGPFGTEPWVATIQVFGNQTVVERVPVGRYHFNLLDGEDRPLGRSLVDVGPSGASVTIGSVPFARVVEKVEIQGTPANPSSPTVVRLLSPGMQGNRTLDAEGGAVIPSLPPGPYEIMVIKGSNLAITSVIAEGASVVGGLVHIPETGNVNLTIVANASIAQAVGGRVLRGEKPESGMLVALVPSKNWRNILAYRFDQSDSDGTFNWGAVPPGDYLAFAFEDGDPSDYADANVITGLAAKGQKVTITGDAKQSISVQVTPR